jgi:hypothetical protein
VNEMRKIPLVPSRSEVVALLRDAPLSSTAPGERLREIQRALKPLLYTSGDNELRFVAFSLVALVDDVFYNASGDFPYDEHWGSAVKTVRRTLLSDLLGGLPALAAALEQSDSAALFKCGMSLVDRYLDAVIDIRNRTSRVYPA